MITPEQLHEEMSKLEVKIHADISRNTIVSRMAQWSGLIVATCTLGVMLWKGGAWHSTSERAVHDVEALTSRVTELATTTTRGAAEYIARDTAKNEEMDKRVTRVENAILLIHEIAKSLATLDGKMESLTVQVREHLRDNNKGTP